MGPFFFLSFLVRLLRDLVGDGHVNRCTVSCRIAAIHHRDVKADERKGSLSLSTSVVAAV